MKGKRIYIEAKQDIRHDVYQSVINIIDESIFTNMFFRVWAKIKTRLYHENV